MPYNISFHTIHLLLDKAVAELTQFAGVSKESIQIPNSAQPAGNSGSESTDITFISLRIAGGAA